MNKVKVFFRPVAFGGLIAMIILLCSSICWACKLPDYITNIIINTALIICIIVISFAVKKEYGISVYSHIKFKQIKVYNAILLSFIAISVNIISIQTFAILGLKFTNSGGDERGSLVALLIVNYICSLIVAPIIEEIYFRVICIESCKKELGIVISILISSVMFSFVHFRAFTNSVDIFIFALLAGLIYIKTKNVCYTMIMHFANNLFLILLDELYKLNIPVYKSEDGIININTYFAVAFILITLVLGAIYLIRQKKTKVATLIE